MNELFKNLEWTQRLICITRYIIDCAVSVTFKKESVKFAIVQLKIDWVNFKLIVVQKKKKIDWVNFFMAIELNIIVNQQTIVLPFLGLMKKISM